jgi:hypothetical protein
MPRLLTMPAHVRRLLLLKPLIHRLKHILVDLRHIRCATLDVREVLDMLGLQRKLADDGILADLFAYSADPLASAASRIEGASPLPHVLE